MSYSVPAKSLVSVVIPAFNAMKYLPETVDSVWKQVFDDFEVIIVNDGSTDEITEWAEQQTDPRFKLVSQENRGLAGARNTGIEHAQGKYIAFLDADDVWVPTKLAEQVQAMEENPEAALSYTGVEIINEQSQKTGRRIINRATGHIWPQLILHNVVECGSTPMVKRDFFKSYGQFDRNLGSFVEDWDMWLRLALHHPVIAIEKPLVYYRQHENSASKRWRQMERSFELVLDKAFSSAESKNLSDLASLKRQAYANVYLSLAWKPLQCENKDIEAAKEMRARAVTYDSAIQRTKEYWRLSLAINLMAQLGGANYRRFLQLLHRLRQSFYGSGETHSSM